MIDLTIFAATFAALYTGHHIGDYWVQTDNEAKHKGDAGQEGRKACLTHVLTYIATQAAMLLVITVLGDIKGPAWPVLAGLAFSGVTHYAIDRREHGIMFWVVRHVTPWNANLLRLGVPRAGVRIEHWETCDSCKGQGSGGPDAASEGFNCVCMACRGGGVLPGDTVGDNPSLGTGAWALDQSAHLLLSVFIPALIIAWS